MDSRKEAHNAAEKKAAAQRQYWTEDSSFGDYIIEVDTHLEMLIGRDTNQAKLDYTAELQEEFLTPLEAAWIIAKESFSNPWKND
jgi:hypothetical protein